MSEGLSDVDAVALSDVAIAPSPLLSSDVDGDAAVGTKPPLDPRRHPRLVISYGMNLANATIGAGVLGLPLVMAECGVLFTLLMLAGAALLTDYTLVILARCFYLVGGQDKHYEALGARCYGRWGMLGVSLGSFMINFGALVAYEIVGADLLQPLVVHYVTQHAVWSSRLFVSAVLFVMMLPLSLYKRIGDLWITSTLSVAFVGVFCVVVIVKSIQMGFNQPPVLFNLSTNFFYVFGIILFAFAAHTNVFPQTMEDRHCEWERIIPPAMHLSVSTCFVAYSTIAFCGYMTFFDRTPGNLLKGYASGDVFVDAVQLLLAVTLVLTAPLCSFPARASLDFVAFGGEENPRHASLRFYGEIAGLYVVSFALAILLPEVQVVFNFTGAVGSAATSLIFPALFYLCVRGPPVTRQSWRTLAVLPLLAIVGLGCVSMVVGVVAHAVELFGGRPQ